MRCRGRRRQALPRARRAPVVPGTERRREQQELRGYFLPRAARALPQNIYSPRAVHALP